MKKYIRPLLIVALLAATSMAHAAPQSQALLAKYANVPQVARALSVRADIARAYQDALDAIRVTAQLRLAAVDRQIDSLLAAVDKKVNAQPPKKAAVAKVSKKAEPKKGRRAKADR